MKIALVQATVALVLLPLGCVTVEEQQSKLVSSYIENHADITPEVKAALLSGKVIPRMSHEEAYLASGIKTRKSDYSIWIVTKDRQLMLPPTVIPSGAPVATMAKNATQFDSGSEEAFVIYFDSNNRVTGVERIEGRK